MSGLLSPSTSPITAESAPTPVTKSTLAAKEDAFILPEVEVLRNIDTLPEDRLGTTRSGLPSPSTSPITTIVGLTPVTKSTLGAKEDALMLPDVEVLRNIDTVSYTHLRAHETPEHLVCR